MAFDQLINNAATYYGKEVDAETKRNLRLGTADILGELVLQPHTLTLVEVDRYLSLTKVVIEFDGQTALCQAVQSRPTFCKVIDLSQQVSENTGLERIKNSVVDSANNDIIDFSNFPAPLTT